MRSVRYDIDPKGFSDWLALHNLLTICFAPMKDRIDPPSSLASMRPEDLAAKAQRETLVLAFDGKDLIGCGFGKDRAHDLYLGKLAIHPNARRQGILRTMIQRFAAIAVERNFEQLTLETRIELTENHATFKALGFRITDRTSHPGFTRATSLTMALNL